MKRSSKNQNAAFLTGVYIVEPEKISRKEENDENEI